VPATDVHTIRRRRRTRHFGDDDVVDVLIAAQDEPQLQPPLLALHVSDAPPRHVPARLLAGDLHVDGGSEPVGDRERDAFLARAGHHDAPPRPVEVVFERSRPWARSRV